MYNIDDYLPAPAHHVVVHRLELRDVLHKLGVVGVVEVGLDLTVLYRGGPAVPIVLNTAHTAVGSRVVDRTMYSCTAPALRFTQKLIPMHVHAGCQLLYTV